MGWQEDLHRRNVAEAQATRARIDQGNREMRARTEAANARSAAESHAQHENLMRAINTPVWSPGNFSSPSPARKGIDSSAGSFTPVIPSGGGQPRPQSKYNKVLAVFILLALGTWYFGNGHAALVIAEVGIGLVLTVAVVAAVFTMLKAFVRALPKLIGIGVVCLVIYLVLNHH